MLGTETLATLGIAIGAGVATFFAPCSYALLPGYLGFYVGTVSAEKPSGLRHGLVRGLAAAFGIVAVFGGLAVVVALVGQSLRPYLATLEFVVGLVLVIMGVVLLRGADLGWHVSLPARRRGLFGFAAFGVVYAIAAAGCVAPLFLAVVAQSLTLSPVGAVAVIGGYAGAVASLVVAATVTVGVGHDLGSGRLPAYARIATRLGGLVLVLAGIAQMWLVGSPW
ncbi:MAG: cytochrome c biogenesis CcdA family protein [Natronomonas sp.]